MGGFVLRWDDLWGPVQWLNRLQNRDRRFMLSFTTFDVGLRKSARPSVSVYSIC
jgi:hypothetical protein